MFENFKLVKQEYTKKGEEGGTTSAKEDQEKDKGKKVYDVSHKKPEKTKK